MDAAPDEHMRYDIPKYIFEHEELPNGDEVEIRNYGYGISYGYTPYLSSLVSVVFMKIASLFQVKNVGLIAAARMSSVFFGIATIIVCLQIGKIIFKEEKERYLFAVLIAFFPQFSFLSSYLNNDAISVFATSLILYFWIYGMKNHWNIKSCVGLGIANGISALAYYFGYAFILCSVFIFIVSILKDDSIDKKFHYILFRGILVLFVALMVGGWFFARNYIIHDGDFLGLKTSTEQSEIYAMDGWKPSNRITYKNQEKSIIEMIFGTKWLISTFLSYYAVFGNMSVSIPYIFYLIFIVFLLLGSVFFIRKWMMGEKQNRIFLVTGLLSCIITFLISVWYSYSSDYQPQGRYIISTLPYLMLIMTMGYKEAEGVFIKKRKWQKYFMNIIIIIWITIFGIIFTKFLNPLCSGII